MSHMSIEQPITEQPELRRVARINGIALPLGSMTLAELEAVNGHASERLEAAQRDYQVIGTYLDQRFETIE